MNAPYRAGDLLCATNGHVIGGFQSDAEAKREVPESVITTTLEYLSGTKCEAIKERTLTAEDVNAAWSAWPKTDKCPECDGRGEVDCECTCGDCHGRACMECDGKGVVAGRSVPDDDSQLLVEGVGLFLPDVWGLLVDVMATLGVTQGRITHGSPSKAMRIAFDEEQFILCLMPSIDDQKPPFQTL